MCQEFVSSSPQLVNVPKTDYRVSILLFVLPGREACTNSSAATLQHALQLDSGWRISQMKQQTANIPQNTRDNTCLERRAGPM